MVNFKPSLLKVILTIVFGIIVFYLFLIPVGVCSISVLPDCVLSLVINTPLLYVYLLVSFLLVYCLISLVQKPKKK